MALLSFCRAASKGILEIFKCDSHIGPRISYLAAISSPAISLLETIGTCAILNDSVYVIATALLALEVMRVIDWLAVTPKPVAQLLPSSIVSGAVSVSTIEGNTRLVQDGKGSFLAQSLLPAVSFLRTLSSWASVQRTMADYLYHTYQQPLPSFFFNALALRKVLKSL